MRKKYFFGILFLLGAVAVLSDKLGFFMGLSFGKCIWGALAAAILLKGIQRRRIGSILFGGAFLIIVFDEMLHLEAITPWPVLWAALLGTIGIKLLFPRQGGYYGHRREVPAIGTSKPVGYRESYRNLFGESVKSLSGDLGEVSLENRFGEMQIYFTDVTPINGVLDVYVELTFGEMTLYIPSSWKVAVNVDTLFGESPGGKDGNFEEAPAVRINGSVTFAELDICYV